MFVFTFNNKRKFLCRGDSIWTDTHYLSPPPPPYSSPKSIPSIPPSPPFSCLSPNEMQNLPNPIHHRIILPLLLLLFFFLFSHFFASSMALRMEEKGKKRNWTRTETIGAKKKSANRLSLCDYYNELGIETKECAAKKKKGRRRGKGKAKSRKLPIIKVVAQTTDADGDGYGDDEEGEDNGIGVNVDGSSSSLARHYKFEGIGNYPSCHGYFTNCLPSDNCQNGLVCRSRLIDGKCCKHNSDPQCPVAEKLGYTCLQKNPVNWCNLNSDCATNMLHSHICCPTGCGYNICISNIHQTPVSRRLMLIEEKLREKLRHLPADCPNPFLIRLNCIVPRQSSLCHSARDCPTFDEKFPRRCCLSSCGVNVCLTKFEDGWMIA